MTPRAYVAAAVSLAVLGCSYSRKDETYSATAAITPHYSSIRANIINPICLPCHESVRQATFATYASVLGQIRPGNPEASRFYTEVKDGTMPIDRPMLTDDQLLAIYQWIRNGAPND
jgi:hypothetical protein